MPLALHTVIIMHLCLSVCLSRCYTNELQYYVLLTVAVPACAQCFFSTLTAACPSNTDQAVSIKAQLNLGTDTTTLPTPPFPQRVSACPLSAPQNISRNQKGKTLFTRTPLRQPSQPRSFVTTRCIEENIHLDSVKRSIGDLFSLQTTALKSRP